MQKHWLPKRDPGAEMGKSGFYDWLLTVDCFYRFLLLTIDEIYKLKDDSSLDVANLDS